MNMVALVPARAGSKRIPGKNTRLLGGQPLIAWTLAAAEQSQVFDRIIVSTDDEVTRAIALDCGAVLHRRQPEHATDDAPDLLWVRDVLAKVDCHAFAILRPTSPFRTAATIQRAFDQFTHDEAHSLRAMQLVKEHPGKMWQVYIRGYPAVPLIGDAWPPRGPGLQPEYSPFPWHSQPTQRLPTVYIQNASLEMAWSYVIPAFGTISGRKVAPFFTDGYEGFDLNTEDDWQQAERLLAEGKVALPALARV